MTAKPSPVSLTPRQRPGSPARVFVQLRPRAGPRSGGLGWLSRRRSAARPHGGTGKAPRAVPPASRALSPSPSSFDASLPPLVLWALPLLLPSLLLSSALFLLLLPLPLPSFFSPLSLHFLRCLSCASISLPSLSRSALSLAHHPLPASLSVFSPLVLCLSLSLPSGLPSPSHSE